MSRPPSHLRCGAMLLFAAAALQGCIAKTALDVVTAPVRVTSKAVDLATTSQSEADEKRGRDIRRREQDLANLRADYDKHERKCLEGDNEACRKAVEARAEIEALLPGIPIEPARD